MFLATAASKKWNMNALDVKGAFLQGKAIERKVFLRPPKEANTNKISIYSRQGYILLQIGGQIAWHIDNIC